MGSAALIGIVLLAGIVIAVVYDAPSCTDLTQNQDETGVDCGGSCAYLCNDTVQAPRVQFARAIENGVGRTDVIAYVENRNAGAEANDAPYTVEVFATDGTPLGMRVGTIDLPARSTTALFVPGVAAAGGVRAFVSFEDAMRWRTARSGDLPLVVSRIDRVEGDRPRITALLENPAPEAQYNRTIIATVFDVAGEAIAVSQTVVREVPALGTAEAVFTWNAPYRGQGARVEVVTVPELP